MPGSFFGNHAEGELRRQKGPTMVYNARTLEPMHRLTKQGEEEYRRMLEEAADELLWKAQHPWKALLWKICCWVESL